MAVGLGGWSESQALGTGGWSVMGEGVFGLGK